MRKSRPTSIACHPIHPMLLPFVAASVCDLAYWHMGAAYWAKISLWFIGAGLVMSVLAAVAGVSGLVGQQKVRPHCDVRWYAGGSVLMVLIQLYNGYARLAEGPAAIVPLGLVLSVLAVAVLFFTDWKAWQGVYRDSIADWSPTAAATGPRSQPGTGR